MVSFVRGYYPKCIYLSSNHQVPYLLTYSSLYIFDLFTHAYLLTIHNAPTSLVITKCLTSLHTHHFTISTHLPLLTIHDASTYLVITKCLSSLHTHHFTFSTYLPIVTYLVVTKCLTSLHTNQFTFSTYLAHSYLPSSSSHPVSYLLTHTNNHFTFSPYLAPILSHMDGS